LIKAINRTNERESQEITRRSSSKAVRRFWSALRSVREKAQ
jgi:hypothetical protein